MKVEIYGEPYISKHLEFFVYLLKMIKNWISSFRALIGLNHHVIVYYYSMSARWI